MPDINYTSRDFESLVADLSALIAATNPANKALYLDTQLGQALIDNVAYMGDVVSYGQDVAGQEYFPATARRIASFLRFARSVGYVPRSHRAANAIVTADDIPLAIINVGGTVSAGTYVTGDNRKRYEAREMILIPAGTSSLTLTLYEGQSHQDTFVPTREMSQEFVTNYSVVEQDSWAVYVGDALEENLWTQVPDVRLESGETRTYSVFIDKDGKGHFLFGDKDSGKIPDATVTIQYRTCSGTEGNAPINTINGTLQVNLNGGGTASMAVTNDTSAATGGQDRESAAELKNNIPAFTRSVDKATSIQDYFDLVAPIVDLAFIDLPVTDFAGNIVRVHTWSRAEVDFSVTSGVTPITTTVKYNKYQQSNIATSYAVQKVLVPRTILTVHNVITRPTVATVDLYFSTIRYDLTRPREDVHREIVEAVVGVFENSSGFVIRIADLYEAVRSVTGVQYFLLTRAVFTHVDWDTGDPFDVVQDDYRVDMDPQGDDGGPYPPIQDIVVPGALNPAFYDDAFLYTNELLYNTAVDSTSIQAITLGSLHFDLQS